jgi:hypothetical protein
VLAVFAAAAVAVAAWTAARGPVAITIGGIVSFRNDSVVWPLVVAGVLLLAGGYARAVVRLAVTAGLLALVPTQVYSEKISHVMRTDHPTRAVRDCMVAVRESGTKTGSGVLGVYRDIEHYGYYYYLWRLGEWKFNREFLPDETERRLQAPGEQTPVIISRGDWETLVRRAGAWDATFPARGLRPPVPDDPVADVARNPLRSGARLEENLAVLLPGPFAACLPDVLAAAGQPLWRDPAPHR